MFLHCIWDQFDMQWVFKGADWDEWAEQPLKQLYQCKTTVSNLSTNCFTTNCSITGLFHYDAPLTKP